MLPLPTTLPAAAATVAMPGCAAVGSLLVRWALIEPAASIEWQQRPHLGVMGQTCQTRQITQLGRLRHSERHT